MLARLLMSKAAMCSEQLELVEDKLRDFRTLSDDDGDDKVRHRPHRCLCLCRLDAACVMHSSLDKDGPARQLCTKSSSSWGVAADSLCRWLQTVALSQLDSLRRELISCAKDRLPLVVFAKVWTAPHRNPHMRHKAARAGLLCS